MKNKEIRTLAAWQISGRNLDEYLNVGDLVDDEFYYYFLEVMPPQVNTDKIIQIGEAYSGNNYATLVRPWRSNNWCYLGNINLSLATAAYLNDAYTPEELKELDAKLRERV